MPRNTSSCDTSSPIHLQSESPSKDLTGGSLKRCGIPTSLLECRQIPPGYRVTFLPRLGSSLYSRGVRERQHEEAAEQPVRAQTFQRLMGRPGTLRRPPDGRPEARTTAHRPDTRLMNGSLVARLGAVPSAGTTGNAVD